MDDLSLIFDAAFKLLLLVGGLTIVWRAAETLKEMRMQIAFFGKKVDEHTDRLMKLLEDHEKILDQHTGKLTQLESWQSNQDAVHADRATRININVAPSQGDSK